MTIETIDPPVLPNGDSERWRQHSLFSLDNLYHAYRQCRRRKRNTHNALAFEQDLEAHLLELHQQLTRATYSPGDFLAFMITKPKRREIFAAAFRDRIVHHLLVAHLEPRWERRFIHDSYACRKGKGTHRAVDRLRTFSRQVSANNSRDSWYLQLDIRGFFINLNRPVLYQQLIAHEHDPVIRWLLVVILFHEPTEHCRFRQARRADFEALPAHKTLFKTAPGCGLPIGNLTSQFCANVYLDALDQFIKHTLKVRHYLRYCDDIVLLAPQRQTLLDWEQHIETFLNQRLQLQTNERRRLRPVADGIDFLGYIVRPDYLLVRRRVIGALHERLQRTENTLQQLGMQHHNDGRSVFPWPWELLELLRQWLNAYLAHSAKASSQRLTNDLRQRFLWLEEYFDWQKHRVVFRCPTPHRETRFSAQLGWFKTRLPDHILLIQQGDFWDIRLDAVLSCAHVPRLLPEVDRWPTHFPDHRLPVYQSHLWRSGLAVAWITETGRRLSGIAERALSQRWAAMG